MKLSAKHADYANELRIKIQHDTDTIDDGEGIAMTLFWSFLLDHARVKNLDVEKLAREQLESFIEYARDNFEMVREH